MAKFDDEKLRISQKIIAVFEMGLWKIKFVITITRHHHCHHSHRHHHAPLEVKRVRNINCDSVFRDIFIMMQS